MSKHNVQNKILLHRAAMAVLGRKGPTEATFTHALHANAWVPARRPETPQQLPAASRPLHARHLVCARAFKLERAMHVILIVLCPVRQRELAPEFDYCGCIREPYGLP